MVVQCIYIYIYIPYVLDYKSVTGIGGTWARGTRRFTLAPNARFPVQTTGHSVRSTKHKVSKARVLQDPHASDGMVSIYAKEVPSQSGIDVPLKGGGAYFFC